MAFFSSDPIKRKKQILLLLLMPLIPFVALFAASIIVNGIFKAAHFGAKKIVDSSFSVTEEFHLRALPPPKESAILQQTIDGWFKSRPTAEHRILKLQEESKKWEQQADKNEAKAARLTKMISEKRKEKTDESLTAANKYEEWVPIYQQNVPICRENAQALRQLIQKIEKGEPPILNLGRVK